MQQTVQSYLENRLKTCSQYQLTEADNQLIAQKGVGYYIFKRLTSKKFRKWALPENSTILQLVEKTVTKQTPLKVVYPFGGYKLWSLSTAPEVDWAEFFSISYVSQYLAPILAVHQPGIDFYWTSDEVIIERMNNVSPDQTNRTTQTWQVLLEAFSKYFPNNFKMNFVRIRDLYDPVEFEKELAELVEDEKKLHETYDDETRQQLYRISAFNIKWDGVEPWHKLPENERDQKIKQGAILHNAYIDLKKRVSLIKGEDNILLFTTLINIPTCIPIGTTKSSITKFWTGTGVLAPKKDTFKAVIVSPQQLKAITHNQQDFEEVLVSLLNLENFKKILVFKKPLNF